MVLATRVSRTGPSGVVQQVNLINNDELHLIEVSFIMALSRDDIPLFRSCNDQLRLLDLLLAKLHITSKLLDVDPERLESSRHVTHDLGNQCLHGSDVDTLEAVQVKLSGSRNWSDASQLERITCCGEDLTDA